MKEMTATQRTKDLLQAQGYIVDYGERVNAGAAKRGVHVKNDLFGFADLAAIHPDEKGTLYIQVTEGGHGPERVRKILALNAAKVALKGGNRIWVIDWRWKPIERGSPAKRLTKWEKWIKLEDFKK